ncbi:MAG: hypothetical protein RIR26_97 [Pseudomonadota bacterium]|jgi:two-component system response regulator PilR (NtrC family)
MSAAVIENKVKNRILIVDDEVELRTLLALKFEKSGFTVDTAGSGSEAASLLQGNDYSAILCDLRLPDAPQGAELFGITRRKSNTPLFIAITGYTQDSPEVKGARAAGVEHIFSKPLRLKTIFELLQGIT